MGHLAHDSVTLTSAVPLLYSTEVCNCDKSCTVTAQYGGL